MLPGLKEVDPKLRWEALLRAAVEANVRWSMRQLAETPKAGGSAGRDGRCWRARCTSSIQDASGYWTPEPDRSRPILSGLFRQGLIR